MDGFPLPIWCNTSMWWCIRFVCFVLLQLRRLLLMMTFVWTHVNDCFTRLFAGTRRRIVTQVVRIDGAVWTRSCDASGHLKCNHFRILSLLVDHRFTQCVHCIRVRLTEQRNPVHIQQLIVFFESAVARRSATGKYTFHKYAKIAVVAAAAAAIVRRIL